MTASPREAPPTATRHCNLTPLMAGTAVGARLRCAQCGTEIIVVKGTDEQVVCCGAPMPPREG